MKSSFAHRRTWGPEARLGLVEGYIPFAKYFITIAGPCSVESVEQVDQLAQEVARYGATHFRGGIFRAGTYPNSNHRLGLIDEKLIAAFYAAAHRFDMSTILEVLDYRDEALELYLRYGDCLQVGARQMQNYSLLKLLAQTGKKIFLKRHPGCTMHELLGAAEHLLVSGQCEPVLIERGSTSHMEHVRWDLSISMIPAIKAITKIPIICDASHGTGRRDLVEPMTLAGVAAGADGILVEVHQDPENSISDADQAISVIDFRNLMSKVNKIREVVKC